MGSMQTAKNYRGIFPSCGDEEGSIWCRWCKSCVHKLKYRWREEDVKWIKEDNGRSSLDKKRDTYVDPRVKWPTSYITVYAEKYIYIYMVVDQLVEQRTSYIYRMSFLSKLLKPKQGGTTVYGMEMRNRTARSIS